MTDIDHNYIPSRPDKMYKGKGWISSNNFLGIKSKRVSKNKVLSYKDATKFVHKLKLKSVRDWRELTSSNKIPNDIPNNPDRFYKDEWKDWGDFLGTDNTATQNKVFSSYTEARKFVHSLKLKSQKEWREYCKSGKKPNNVPSVPNNVYKDNGWISMGDFLGTGNVREKDFLSFEAAREVIHSLGLENVRAWREYCKSGKRSSKFPSNPQITYKSKGWTNWKDFLGTE